MYAVVERDPINNTAVVLADYISFEEAEEYKDITDDYNHRTGHHDRYVIIVER